MFTHPVPVYPSRYPGRSPAASSPLPWPPNPLAAMLCRHQCLGPTSTTLTQSAANATGRQLSNPQTPRHVGEGPEHSTDIRLHRARLGQHRTFFTKATESHATDTDSHY